MVVAAGALTMLYNYDTQESPSTVTRPAGRKVTLEYHPQEQRARYAVSDPTGQIALSAPKHLYGIVVLLVRT
jgi:YD repeat-containing protein